MNFRGISYNSTITKGIVMHLSGELTFFNTPGNGFCSLKTPGNVRKYFSLSAKLQYVDVSKCFQRRFFSIFYWSQLVCLFCSHVPLTASAGCNLWLWPFLGVSIFFLFFVMDTGKLSTKYPQEVQLNSAYTVHIEDNHLSISNGVIFLNNMTREIKIFQLFGGVDLRTTSYELWKSQCIWLVRASWYINDFYDRSKLLTAKLFQQKLRHH